MAWIFLDMFQGNLQLVGLRWKIQVECVVPHRCNQHDHDCWLGRFRGRIAKGFRATLTASRLSLRPYERPCSVELEVKFPQ